MSPALHGNHDGEVRALTVTSEDLPQTPQQPPRTWTKVVLVILPVALLMGVSVYIGVQHGMASVVGKEGTIEGTVEQYEDLAGYPAGSVVTTSTSPSPAGSTSIEVADTTGMSAGMSLTISGGGFSEMVFIVSVVLSLLFGGRRLSAGTVNIDPALKNSYPAGASIVASPATAEQAQLQWWKEHGSKYGHNHYALTGKIAKDKLAGKTDADWWMEHGSKYPEGTYEARNPETTAPAAAGSDASWWAEHGSKFPPTTAAPTR